MDTERFKPGNGTATPISAVHVDLFLRAKVHEHHKNSGWCKPDLIRFLNAVGKELWIIIHATRPGCG